MCQVKIQKLKDQYFGAAWLYFCVLQGERRKKSRRERTSPFSQLPADEKINLLFDEIRKLPEGQGDLAEFKIVCAFMLNELTNLRSTLCLSFHLWKN